MTKTLLLSITLLAAAFVLLGVKVLFVKGGKFPSGHAHSSPELRRRGVSCATLPEHKSVGNATVYNKPNQKNSR
ncbi:MAG: hypothetical protein K2G24_08115 [Muribaculaceae bacterium]|nr:hypothetical protein [Muribaculaceae bacterium]